MRIVTTGILMGFIILLSGCMKDVVSTALLDNIVTKEVVVPVAACPKQVDEIKYPTRPALAIDDLLPADAKNYDKVGKAYMTTIKDLLQYSKDLEDVAYGVRDLCHSVNTPISGK